MYTNIKMMFNGVIVSDVTIPGIPKKLPIQFKPGGHLPGVGKSTPHDYWFQWWYSVYDKYLRYSFSEWYDWTGNGPTVTYFATGCEDNGGYWDFLGCYTEHSDTGRPRVHSYGHWAYGCCQTPREYVKRPHADVDVFPDGTITGSIADG